MGRRINSRAALFDRRADFPMVKLHSVTEQATCPTCKHRMELARSSPGERGYEERIFECRTCHRTEKISFLVDPMKTDALGWLDGELKPPSVSNYLQRRPKASRCSYWKLESAAKLRVEDGTR
jgi:hypothetical protein